MHAVLRLLKPFKDGYCKRLNKIESGYSLPYLDTTAVATLTWGRMSLELSF